MKKNVLASNPLEMMFALHPRSETVEQLEQTGKGTSPVVVSIDANTSRSATHVQHAAPLIAPAHEVVVSAPSPVQAVEPSDGAVGSVSIGTGLNRIGTLHKPYVRQKDGVQTRQASVTLPVDMLRKVGHCAVDTRMKTSEVIKEALEEYLERRGY